MIIAAAVCLILVGLMHSVLGHMNLIAPLLARDDFPHVLGSQRNGRLNLFSGWHALTLFWWAQAIVLLSIAQSPGAAVDMTLRTLSVTCLFIGLLALVVSKGRHLSWVFFLPIAALLGFAV